MTTSGFAFRPMETALSGAIFAPGDKSISHRALILAAMAEGESRISGLLDGDDVFRTAVAMRALGADVERDARDWIVTGAKWRNPDRPLYFGNAGTGVRLVMGATAGAGIAASFDGDGSLRRRPMDRILDPLRQMGMEAQSGDGFLPVRMNAGMTFRAIDYTLPKPSAQIKSAIILAALGGEGTTVVREPVPCRDHTERMIPAFGGEIEIEAVEMSARRILVRGGQSLTACDLAVPGDPSSAAFAIAAALISPGSDLVVRNVMLNPSRTGFLSVLREMGAALSIENKKESGGETVGDVRVRHANLCGVTVPAERAPSMIDEYPILSVVAAFAEGETRMEGLSELRIKESDRIAAIEAGLRANGVDVESGPDWLSVRGGGVPGGGRVMTHHDHRIAMSFLILGLGAEKPVSVDDISMIATSYPGFFSDFEMLGVVAGQTG
ncbi:MAG: 3-phosphoshikimate 1-carboxyvinyltransferase [Pseudomonadota bacterium]